MRHFSDSETKTEGFCGKEAAETESYKLARRAYEGYCRKTGWRSLVTGDELPQFDTLNPEIQAAWESAVFAVCPQWRPVGELPVLARYLCPEAMLLVKKKDGRILHMPLSLVDVVTNPGTPAHLTANIEYFMCEPVLTV